MLLGVFGAPLFISTFPRGGRLAPRVGLGLEDGMGGQTRLDGLLQGRRGLATGQHPCSSVTVTEPFKLGRFAPPSPPREQVAGKLICQDSGTLCDPGFGDVGKGPARGHLSIPVAAPFLPHVSFSFVPAVGFLSTTCEKALGRGWLGVFLTDARQAQGCFDG